MGGRQTRAAERGEQRRARGPRSRWISDCSLLERQHRSPPHHGPPAPSRALLSLADEHLGAGDERPGTRGHEGRCDLRTSRRQRKARSAREGGPHRWRGETCLSASAVRMVHDASQVFGLGRVELGAVRSAAYDPCVVIPAEHQGFARQTEMWRSVDRLLTFRARAVPRGLLEFVADPASPRLKAEFDPIRRVIVYCRSDTRGALATRLEDSGVRGHRQP